jgi:hypothetical protein
MMFISIYQGKRKKKEEKEKEEEVTNQRSNRPNYKELS